MAATLTTAARVTRPRRAADPDAKLRRLAGRLNRLLGEIDDCLAGDPGGALEAVADDLRGLAWAARLTRDFIDSEVYPPSTRFGGHR